MAMRSTTIDAERGAIARVIEDGTCAEVSRKYFHTEICGARWRRPVPARRGVQGHRTPAAATRASATGPVHPFRGPVTLEIALLPVRPG